MALIQGQFGIELTSNDHRDNVSASIQEFGYPDLKLAHNYLSDDYTVEGTLTRAWQSNGVGAVSGELSMDFFTDFYSRIYFIPDPLDLGEIVSDDSGDLVLWNANIYDDSVSSITVAGLTPDTNFDSTLFTETTPLAFKPLENKVYTWDVERAGDDDIAVTVEISTNAGDFTLPIAGRRGIFFSASPLNQFDHKYSFKTRIAESYNGEQRSSLSTIPQETFNYKASIKTLDRYNFQANMQEAARLSVSIPMWEDYMLHGDVPINTTYIENFDADFKGRPFYVGGIAVLWQDEVTYNLVKIKSVAADGMRLDFERPTEIELTNAFLIPVRSGVMVDPARIKTDGLDHHIVEVSISSIEHQPDFDRDVTLETFESKYVLTSPNFQKANTENFGVDYDTFEGIGGDRAVFLDRGYRVFKSKYVWKCFDRGSLNELREFIFATKGKWKSFWLPRFGNDFVVSALALKDQTFIEVTASQFTTNRANVIGQALMIHRKDGTREYFRITNVEPQGAIDRVSISAPLASDLQQSDIFSLCIMDLVRLSSDKITVKIKDISDVSCSLSVVGVNNG